MHKKLVAPSAIFIFSLALNIACVIAFHNYYILEGVSFNSAALGLATFFITIVNMSLLLLALIEILWKKRTPIKAVLTHRGAQK
jgi:hypothetical protein